MLVSRGAIVYIVIGAFILSVFVFDTPVSAVFAGAYPEAQTIGKDVASFDELADRFTELSQEKGALYGFEILRRAKLPPNTDLHLLGHVVGDELYRQKGPDGIVYCTQEFRNACSHSIVIGTLNNEGTSGLNTIREGCKKAPGGPGAYTMCFHGLGHGVFSHFAFQFPETVDFCKRTGTDEYNDREYIECVGGAVMELMGGGGHDPYNWEKAREQYLDPDKPLSLCLSDTIPEKVKSICLMYLTPYIWDSVDIELGRPEPEKFSEAFAICDEISQTRQNLRDACFGGFGKEFIPLVAGRDIRTLEDTSDRQLKIAGSWCMYADARDGRNACIAEAVSSAFWGGENDPDLAFRFCSLVRNSDVQDACHQRLAEEIQQYILDSKRKTVLCNRIPERLRDTCRD